jgi:hypothetical protein
MSPTIIGEAVEMAGRVRDAGRLRPFKHAVSEFIRVLGAVPDEDPGILSDDRTRVLQSLGQDVIDCIEDRVPGTASVADAQTLVGSVYEVRRLLEEVSGVRRRHHAIARHL